MKTELKTITPAWARDRLEELRIAQEEGKFCQHQPRQRAIQRYAADMTAGKWLITHQGIAFDEEGNLLDGQNRLWAIVRANVPVKMQVSTGVEGDGKIRPMDVIDNGMTRSLGNQLRISHGYSNANEAAALVRGVVTLTCFSFMAKNAFSKGAKDIVQVSAQEAIFILQDLGFEKALERAMVILEKHKMRHRATGQTSFEF